MAIPNFYASAYMIIENEKGEILFSQRINTGFRDGAYQLPAGHMDGNETMIECAIREAKEELDIDALAEDCEVVHISHRISSKERGGTGREYFDIYVKIKNYSGELKINEPEKCGDLIFMDIDNIPEDKKDLFSYDLDIVRKIKNGVKFSEVN